MTKFLAKTSVLRLCLDIMEDRKVKNYQFNYPVLLTLQYQQVTMLTISHREQ